MGQLNKKNKSRTNYRKRLKLLKGKGMRLVIRKSLKHTTIQLIEYYEKGDKVITASSSKELEKLFNWKLNGSSIPSAYLVGFLIGKKLKGEKKKNKGIILDIGNSHPAKGSAIFSALKGVLDAGIDIPHSPDIFPSESAIKGAAIAEYFKKLKTNTNSKNQFSGYLNDNVDVAQIQKNFEDLKKKIQEGNYNAEKRA